MTAQQPSRFLPVDLAGSRVVITAAATGIGYTMAEAFLARGARVAICDINRSALDSATKSFPGALVREADVSRPDAVADFFAAVYKEMGGVDVLVNNAGIAGPTANVEDVTPEALSQTLDINVAGQFYAARHVTPGMKSRRKGCIINLSSIAGRLAFAMRSPYAASKWAVVGFTKSLAAELGEFDITVNAILPGHVRTERFSRVVAAKAKAIGVPEEQMRRAYLEPVSLKRNVEMDDIANMALYLASPFGRNITGQALSVCGDVQMMR
jgi:NAD(P)-dependent dehydrogenase (short-subunit alcohol dehydrogenase family)